ncbi:MAG TPA: protein-L-isoaspartate(D-aspartate) O-methyltransferase [Solirubrobacteraceae bacterium]|nr:protein-L-isoaspartate(D-aspartate) O-methyltransferase [Solirubrobacteraceae bacterium]
MDPAQGLARQLARSVRDERVLDAVAAVPRHQFVPHAERTRAYENTALPIDCEQTISQPVVVARMLELLELTPSDRVLDVGTGSGYHAALLGLLAGEVWTVERHAQLSAQACAVLANLGYANVICVVGDGWEGLPEQAPFNAINVAAATGAEVPRALVAQLAPGGRLVAPVGDAHQYLTRIRRTADGLRRERLDPVRFVPLVRDLER